MIKHVFSSGDIIARSGKYFKQKTAIIFEDQRISYEELNDHINKLANALLDTGIGTGDKVSILFLNSPQFIESYLAVVKTGAMVVPLNFRLTGHELTYILQNSDSRVLIYDGSFSQIIESIRPQLPSIRTYICYGESISQNTLNYEQIMAEAATTEPGIEVQMEAGCALCYTAGTTGFPKGAVRTHGNCIWTTIGSVINMRFRADDVVLCVPPLFHAVGWDDLTLATFLLGGTLVLVKNFDPADTAKLIEREKVNLCILVPSMILMMKNQPEIDKYDLSSLRVFGSGGAVMPTELKRWVMGRLPTIEFIDAYGMTETGWIGSLLPWEASRKDATQGIPSFHQKVRIVGDEGRDVSINEVGKIIVKGPQVIKEYYNDPEITKHSIIDGWFHTGDLAYFDEDRYIYMVDRKKDMIITGGENVYSTEVENVIYTHPKVMETAVIGIPHQKWGEQVIAVVTLKQGEIMTDKELIDFCHQQLAGYKCPKEVEFTPPLPRSSSGKILKRELRGRLC